MSYPTAEPASAAHRMTLRPSLGRWRPLHVAQRLLRRPSGYQAGDGREQALATHVLTTTTSGDIDAIIDAIDQFTLDTASLTEVEPGQGAILEDVVRATAPERLLELGTYCGYSALRIVRAMPPTALLYSVEPSSANAIVARRIWQHARVVHRVKCIVGTLGDRSCQSQLRAAPSFARHGLDFVFLDHDEDAYLSDLERLVAQGWLRTGSVVVADNVTGRGNPDYLSYMRDHDGTSWQTTEHETHRDRQPTTADFMLSSRYQQS